MVAFSQQLLELRRAAELTQVELSVKAGVSLATIQGIERGTGNPSLRTLNKILDALDHDFELKPQPADWDLLARGGVPLSVGAGYKKRSFPSIAAIYNELKKACLELKWSSEEDERKLLAIEVYLWTANRDYGESYKKFLKSQLFQEFLPREITGRHIKLRRVCKGMLAAYL